MNLQNVKLVVTDMDGTLLNNKGEVSNQFFNIFTKLKNKNIHFCAASGRQYNSIVNKLAPIKDDIFVIAENGAVAKKGYKTLALTAINKQKVVTIIPTLRKIKDANIVLCTENTAYIESKNETFIQLFQEYYHNYIQVDNLVEVAEKTPVLKIAVYHFNSSEKYVYPEIKHLKDEYLLKISGKNWLDVSDENANKGNALRKVQKLLNVTKEETMVFGDYHNDIEMLQEAHFSFAMENAHNDIKKIANYNTNSNENFGVETILEKLVNF